MSDAQNLVALIEESVNAILRKTNSNSKPSEELVGDINNDACDIHFYIRTLAKLIEIKAR